MLSGLGRPFASTRNSIPPILETPDPLLKSGGTLRETQSIRVVLRVAPLWVRAVRAGSGPSGGPRASTGIAGIVKWS